MRPFCRPGRSFGLWIVKVIFPAGKETTHFSAEAQSWGPLGDTLPLKPPRWGRGNQNKCKSPYSSKTQVATTDLHKFQASV